MHPPLGRRELEGQLLGEAALELAGRLDDRRRVAVEASAQRPQGEMVGQQLLEGETLLTRMCAGDQARNVGIGRRPVQINDCLSEFG